jgi:hypothetical protein
VSNTVLRSAKSLSPRLGSASLAAPTSATAASLARFGQSPATPSAIASNGSHTSASRSSTPVGISGRALVIASKTPAAHAVRRSRKASPSAA